VLILITLVTGFLRPSDVLIPPHLKKNLLLPFLIFLESWGFTALVIQAVKIFVGRKRPNFYAMCNYKGYRDALSSGNFTSYYEQTVPGAQGDMMYCLETDVSTLNESQFSFPSGHSGEMFGGLTILFLLWIASVPVKNDSRKIWQFRLWRIVPMIIFLGASVVVACTRTRDYWHNFDDIVGGGLIGIGVAYFTFYGNNYLREEEIQKNEKHVAQEA